MAAIELVKAGDTAALMAIIGTGTAWQGGHCVRKR
jgi:hypothetical protein